MDSCRLVAKAGAGNTAEADLVPFVSLVISVVMCAAAFKIPLNESVLLCMLYKGHAHCAHETENRHKLLCANDMDAARNLSQLI